MPAKPENLVQISPMVRTAVVSPCASCRNQRDEMTVEGYWPCPRRVWAKRAKTQTEIKAIPQYLLVKGDEDKDKFRNPVYAEEQKLILVWTADLVNNAAVYEPGKEEAVNPHILDPNFNTKYIRCNELPCLVSETEASYYQNGAYQSMQHLLIFAAAPFQIPLSGENLMVEGFAQRVSLAFAMSYKTHEEDVIVSGL